MWIVRWQQDLRVRDGIERVFRTVEPAERGELVGRLLVLADGVVMQFFGWRPGRDEACLMLRGFCLVRPPDRVEEFHAVALILELPGLVSGYRILI